MDSVESIAAFSTAQKQAELQIAIATKVLKMAQGQSQVTADFLSSAMENAQQQIEQFVGDQGSAVDTYA